MLKIMRFLRFLQNKKPASEMLQTQAVLSFEGFQASIVLALRRRPLYPTELRVLDY